MNFKSITALFLALFLCLSLVACSGGDKPTIDPPSSENNSSTVSSEETPAPEAPKYLNTLTGELSLSEESATSKKPIAITINNVRTAQKVQTGLDLADVVFETEVEGGITRLLALFADPTNVPKLGTVRSLRVPFAEIACGMDAILFYHGIDYDYCAPHLKKLDIESYQIGSKSSAFREKNGLAYEHTLYTTGKMLDNTISSQKLNDKGSGKTWLNFSEKTDKIAPAETVAKTISVPFSSSYVTQFLYDEESGKYARARKGVAYTDAVSGEKELFTNIFVLETTISYYPDNKHRKVNLSSGSGYYASAGGVVPIKWEKGDSEDNFKFTLEDGSKLTVNQGNSYVCIMNKSRTPEFK